MPDRPTRIRFTSALSTDHREQLEALLFFNERQGYYRDVVIESIERFGEPKIRDERGLLRIHTSTIGEAQALFAVEEADTSSRPVGVAVYTLSAPDTLVVVHMAVHDDFAAGGASADRMVTLRLTGEVVKAASRIKGVRAVMLLYGPGAQAGTTIPVRMR